MGAAPDRGRRIARALEVLGPHWATRLHLDLEAPAGRGRWLAVARLASERDPEATLLAAASRLDAEIGAGPETLAAAGPERIASLLAEAGLRRPEPVARGLWRAGAGLVERHGGDLDALAGECLDLEELGGRLSRLAPGLGAATLLRFLRPLRGVWSAARETPLAPQAHAAAVHLGLIETGADLDGEPAAFLAACAEHAAGLPARDVEAALERLGARACARGRPERCPLAEVCPARGAALEGGGLAG